jgi:hypothetical protein
VRIGTIQRGRFNARCVKSIRKSVLDHWHEKHPREEYPASPDGKPKAVGDGVTRLVTIAWDLELAALGANPLDASLEASVKVNVHTANIMTLERVALHRRGGSMLNLFVCLLPYLNIEC